MEAVLLVAGTSAVAILADGFVAAISRFVFVRSIITRMTTCAIRLECGELPDYDFAVVLVTLCAGQVAAMIQRFKRCCRMSELIRDERIGVVATVALLRGNEVARVFADGVIAVMARRA